MVANIKEFNDFTNKMNLTDMYSFSDSVGQLTGPDIQDSQLCT